MKLYTYRLARATAFLPSVQLFKSAEKALDACCKQVQNNFNGSRHGTGWKDEYPNSVLEIKRTSDSICARILGTQPGNDNKYLIHEFKYFLVSLTVVDD